MALSQQDLGTIFVGVKIEPAPTSQPDSKSLQQTVSEGNQFRQISPRTRADRRTIESKDELARQRCIQRNDGYHRLPHQNNYNLIVFVLGRMELLLPINFKSILQMVKLH